MLVIQQGHCEAVLVSLWISRVRVLPPACPGRLLTAPTCAPSSTAAATTTANSIAQVPRNGQPAVPLVHFLLLQNAHIIPIEGKPFLTIQGWSSYPTEFTLVGRLVSYHGNLTGALVLDL